MDQKKLVNIVLVAESEHLKAALVSLIDLHSPILTIYGTDDYCFQCDTVYPCQTIKTINNSFDK